MKPYVVGVSGGSGAGKTFILSHLVEKLGADNVCLISQDNYYLPRESQPLDEEGIHNFDTLRSVDMERCFQDVEAVLKGQTVELQEYTFNNPNKKPKTLCFSPKPIILVEGIFIYNHPLLRDLIDLKIFLDVSEHIRLKRRVLRDNVERGYDLQDVLYRYEKHVYPAYGKYISPFKKKVDLIIPNNERYEKALDVLSTFLGVKLAAYQKHHQQNL
ncbi:uridine kinase family protein [Eisenibacter elegans]|jgi:uridine kinase|uniref:uridine kinase family protein n=1 Tax=Eisenibacter elegans TaxID=997 RepID=UPI000402DF75|nr:uridine kinase [Eisenibacter elegans]